MTNFTGTITGAATTTVAATTIRTQMQTTIPTNTAWSLVESTTMNAGAIPCDVYKCAAAGSGLSADFYVAVMQSGANLMMSLAEGYNTSTHKPKRPAMAGTATAQTLQADGGVLASTTEIDWYNGTSNPGGGLLNVATQSGANVISPSTTDDYQIIVAIDGVFLYIRTAAQFLHVGAYSSSVPTPATNDPLPILQTKSSASSGNTTYATRMPLSGSASRGWPCNCNGRTSAETNGNSLSSSTPADSSWTDIGFLGGATVDHYDLYSSATGPQALRVPIWNSYTSGSATLGRDKNGWLRGYFKHMYFIGASSGVVVGDTCTVGGVGYTAMSLSANNGIWVETNPT